MLPLSASPRPRGREHTGPLYSERDASKSSWVSTVLGQKYPNASGTRNSRARASHFQTITKCLHDVRSVQKLVVTLGKKPIYLPLKGPESSPSTKLVRRWRSWQPSSNDLSPPSTTPSSDGNSIKQQPISLVLAVLQDYRVIRKRSYIEKHALLQRLSTQSSRKRGRL
jgi:hypothetical protein